MPLQLGKKKVAKEKDARKPSAKVQEPKRVAPEKAVAQAPVKEHTPRRVKTMEQIRELTGPEPTPDPIKDTAIQERERLGVDLNTGRPTVPVDPGQENEATPQSLLPAVLPADFDPYHAESLEKAKIPGDVMKFEDLGADIPMIEFLSDLPDLMKMERVIDAMIDALNLRKEEIRTKMLTNLQVVSIEEVIVGRFQVSVVSSDKPQETLDKKKLFTSLVQLFTSNGLDVNLLQEAIKGATNTKPPREPHIRVTDLVPGKKKQYGQDGQEG